MSIETLNTPMIAFFDGIGESVVPTANFTPPTDSPLSNLSNSQLFSRARTPDLTADRQLTFDWGSAIEHNVFMLAGTNATIDTTRRIRDADDSGFTTGVVESGGTLTSAFDTGYGQSRAVYVPPWGRTLIYVYADSVTKRYTRLYQSDVGNPDGYMEWGIARVGLGFQPQYGVESHKPLPKIAGVSGSEKLLRGHEISYHYLTRVEAYDLESILRTMLSSRRVLLLVEPLTPSTWLNDAIWCVCEDLYLREPVPGTANAEAKYKVQLTFREVEW